MKERCVNCGTEFDTDKAPWLKKKLHCIKHDAVYAADSTCSHCDAEKADEEARRQLEITAHYGKPDESKEGGDNAVGNSNSSTSASATV